MLKRIFSPLIILSILLMSAVVFSQDPENANALPDLMSTKETSDDKSVRPEAAPMEKSPGDFSKEISALQEAVESGRRRLADQGADISELRDHLKALIGKLDALLESIGKTDRKLDSLNSRIAYIEKFLDTGKSKAKPPASGNRNEPNKEAQKDASAGDAVPDGDFNKQAMEVKPDSEATPDAGEHKKETNEKKTQGDDATTGDDQKKEPVDGKTAGTAIKDNSHRQNEEAAGDTPNKETIKEASANEAAYESALKLFKEEKYETARLEFIKYINRYPDTEQAVHAQYWIGESLYFVGNYEQAILEYEKVIKIYPEGDKTPLAFLKEGMCFLKLGDTATAKLLFRQVIQKYPASGQAVIARAKLEELK